MINISNIFSLYILDLSLYILKIHPLFAVHYMALSQSVFSSLLQAFKSS